MNIVKSLSEAIVLSWTSMPRYERYLDLVAKKFKLGERGYLNIAAKSNIFAITYGPTNNRLLKNKYVYLFSAPTTNNKIVTLSSFWVSNEPLSKNDIRLDGKKILVNNKPARPIPNDFIKMEHVFSLIVGAGASLNDKSTELDPTITDEPVVQFNINERFDMMKNLVAMVAFKAHKGLIITGSGGVGKTYTVTQTLESLGLTPTTPTNLNDLDDGEEDLDPEEGTKSKSMKSDPNAYVHVMGAKLTTTSFYALLYHNRDSFILFDDSDSVLQNPDIINMLKAALESGNKPRIVTYLSSAVTNAGMDTSFEFTGRLIFISNLPMASLDQPIRTRVNTVDVSMTRKETFERMQYIVDTYKDDPVKYAFYQEALNFMMQVDEETNHRKPSNISMRLLDNVVGTLSSPNEIFAGDPVKAKQMTMKYQITNA